MEPLNCWEYWSCCQEVRSECPAFITNYGMNCFDFSEDYCPRAEKDFGDCRECPWYKKIQAKIREIKNGVML